MKGVLWRGKAPEDHLYGLFDLAGQLLWFACENLDKGGLRRLFGRGGDFNKVVRQRGEREDLEDHPVKTDRSGGPEIFREGELDNGTVCPIRSNPTKKGVVFNFTVSGPGKNVLVGKAERGVLYH